MIRIGLEILGTRPDSAETGYESGIRGTSMKESVCPLMLLLRYLLATTLSANSTCIASHHVARLLLPL